MMKLVAILLFVSFHLSANDKVLGVITKDGKSFVTEIGTKRYNLELEELKRRKIIVDVPVTYWGINEYESVVAGFNSEISFTVFGNVICYISIDYKKKDCLEISEGERETITGAYRE